MADDPLKIIVGGAISIYSGFYSGYSFLFLTLLQNKNANHTLTKFNKKMQK